MLLCFQSLLLSLNKHFFNVFFQGVMIGGQSLPKQRLFIPGFARRANIPEKGGLRILFLNFIPPPSNNELPYSLVPIEPVTDIRSECIR